MYITYHHSLVVICLNLHNGQNDCTCSNYIVYYYTGRGQIGPTYIHVNIQYVHSTDKKTY